MMQTSKRGRSNRPPRGRGIYQNSPRNTQAPHHHPDHPAYSSVPPYSAIHPGSGVSIVLKEDQPTGRQVKGIVADLLTRGDHPRGVKVRLRDGRVGRVQGLISSEEGESGEASVGGAGASLGRNGEGTGSSGSRGGNRMIGGRVERDIRDEDEYLYDENRRPDASAGLFAALEQADKQHQEARRGGSVEEEQVVTCPVCSSFHGDERAVAFHVEEHFAG